MRLKYVLLMCYLSLLSGVTGYGQNLVPNSSFEDYTVCPTDLNQIWKCTGWINCGDTISTPDYYNFCNNGIVNPLSNAVYQVPHSGNAYAAFVTKTPYPNYREYIRVQLSQTLTPGMVYFLSFYVTLAKAFGFSAPSNNIGVKMSTIPFSTINPTTITNSATFNVSQIIQDSSNWTFVSGNFIADSAYNYLIFGNFFYDINTSFIDWHPGSSNCYYAIDDVCLSTDSSDCVDITNINELDFKQVVLYPNPTYDIIYLKSEIKEHINTFYDLNGKRMSYYFFNNSNYALNISEFTRGLYYLIIQDKNGNVIYKGKIQKL